MYLHCELKKLNPFSFERNFCKYCPHLIILSLLKLSANCIHFFTKTVDKYAMHAVISLLVPSVLHLSHGFQCFPTLNRQPYEGRLPLTSWWRKFVEHDNWPIQPDILNPPLLRLTSGKRLWLDLQPWQLTSKVDRGRGFF